MTKLKLGFLASHGGSNMQAIIDAINNGTLDAEACVVISNNSESKALERAEKEGIPAFHMSSAAYPDSDELDRAIAMKMIEHNCDLVILAGYMKKIGDAVLRLFKGRILNIHPALLPKYGGKGMYGSNVHKAVIAAAEKESGPTIHVVDAVYDNGKILSQSKVPVLEDDTFETLAARVLEQEHILYAKTLQEIVDGSIKL